MKNRFVLTITDVFLVCSPLLILFFVVFSEGYPPGDILKKPEWSFVSIFFIVESFRDFGKVWKSRGEHEEQIEAGYIVMAIFLVLTALILNMDYQHSIGTSPLTTNFIYFAKFAWFGMCLAIFTFTRWKRHSI